MIITESLAKRFGPRRVLCGLDLAVNPGAVTLLVGANGAGKTTFLRIITGLCRPDHGRVIVADCDIVQQRLAALNTLAFLPQAPRFHPRLTTQQVARYYGQLRGRTDDDVTQALERWGLQEHLHATTAHLSGGLRQRLAIAVFALARAPVLVATHLLGEWEGKVDACVLLESGRVSGALPPDRLRESFPSFERVSPS